MAPAAVPSRVGPARTSDRGAQGAGVPLVQAVAALQRRLGEVEAALDLRGDAPVVDGFGVVPLTPPSRRERALLVQFAWVAYRVLAGRPPAAAPPTEWPWQLARVTPLVQLRPDVPPALARIIERVLTAPPMAPLPSVAGIAELLRRAAPRLPTPPHGVQLAIELRPAVPEPAAVVVARLTVLATVLANAPLATATERRRGLFRLGWTGWERLTGAMPWPTDLPYVLQLGHHATPERPDIIAAPEALWTLLEQLLQQGVQADIPTVHEVKGRLLALAVALGAEVPDAAAARPDAGQALADGVAVEATRLLDALAAAGAVRPGPSAAVAQSLDERLAVTGLAWGVYRAATGGSPLGVDAQGATAYVPLADAAPSIAPTLAQVVDATLAPTARDVPGVAAWLAAAEQASQHHAWRDAEAEGSPPANVEAKPNGGAAADTASNHADAPPPPGHRRPARRAVELLPPDAPSRRVGTTVPWVAGLGVAAAVWWLTALRASGGP